jgi:AcrR family transcriptional regulator
MKNSEIQQQIVQAAEVRFKLYGYQKTTMAEISGDCQMSAANLYRYFDNKLAIAAVLAKTCLQEIELSLSTIVSNEQLPAGERLQQFVLSQLHQTYHYFDSAPKLGELVEAMTTQRPEIIEAHRQQKIVLLKQLLQQGKSTKEFVFDDLAETADAIHSATLLFYFPLTLGLYPLAILEEKAAHVNQLLLRGLKNHNEAHI